MNDNVDMEPAQKAAAILVAMGKENAAKMIAHFQQDEIRNLMIASSKMTSVPQDILNSLIEEFERDFVSGPGLLDSGTTIQSMIEEALTPEQLEELSKDPNAREFTRQTKSFWEILDDVDMEDLIKFLIAENTHAAAYTITRLSPEKSAMLVNSLEKEDRKRIVAGMITSRPPTQAIIDSFEAILRETFGRSTEAEPNNDAPKKVAGLFNELDMDVSEELFSELAGTVNQERLQTVKSLMFRFENIILLEATDRAKLFDTVSTELVTIALRDVDPDLQEAILSALGQRTRRMLESELGNPSTATEDDILKARKDIASIVLRLSGEGKITIPAPDDMAA